MPTKQAVWDQHQALCNRILYFLCPCEEGKALGERLMRRYLEYVYLLPASAQHHHAEPGGLWAHSLDGR